MRGEQTRFRKPPSVAPWSVVAHEERVVKYRYTSLFQRHDEVRFPGSRETRFLFHEAVVTHHPLIGVDWGSTNLRAFLFSDEGRVLDVLQGSAIGGDYAKGLRHLLQPWLKESSACPVLICGMAGARGGWKEAAYMSVPAGVEGLASLSIAPPDFPTALIVPGVSRRAGGRADVMRGEEVQALGSKISDGMVIAPGTHSKWITLSEGQIVDLTTYVTGELYAGLLRLGFLAGVTDGEAFDRDAFRLGVASAASGASLLELAFAIRAGVLIDGFPETHVAARLSGLLIGTELESARRSMALSAQTALVCEPGLADLYVLAFEHLGLGPPVRLDPVATTARGLWAVHLALQRQNPS